MEKKRALLVENVLSTDNANLRTGLLYRYQFDNHLGSSCQEYTKEAVQISYEEYYPYGGSSYQVFNIECKASTKRYRYTGKERDEEIGLYYHLSRYFLPWLARWASCDPKGLVDGLSSYPYVQNNPLSRNDPTGGQSEEIVDSQGRTVPDLNNIALTTDPIMAERINQVTRGQLEQTWDLNTRSYLPVGALRRSNFNGTSWIY